MIMNDGNGNHSSILIYNKRNALHRTFLLFLQAARTYTVWLLSGYLVVLWFSGLDVLWFSGFVVLWFCFL